MSFQRVSSRVLDSNLTTEDVCNGEVDIPTEVDLFYRCLINGPKQYTSQERNATRV